MSSHNRLALTLIILCYMSWGSDMVAMKLAFEAFTPLQVMAARVMCPALLYLLLFPKWKNARIRPGDIKFFILLAMFEPCLFFCCVTNAMRFTTASEGSIIAACLPLFISFGAWLFLHERITLKAICLLCCALAGIIGLNITGAPSEHAPDPLLGNTLMIFAMLFSMGYTLLARKLSRIYSGMIISIFQAFTGCLIFVPLSFTQPWPTDANCQSVFGILWLGVWIGFAVYLAYNWSLGRIKASIAGSMGYISPISGLILAWLMLGEKLGVLQLVFSAITIAATVMAGRELIKDA